MVKYRQTRLDEFEEYKELVKGVPVVRWKILPRKTGNQMNPRYTA